MYCHFLFRVPSIQACKRHLNDRLCIYIRIYGPDMHEHSKCKSKSSSKRQSKSGSGFWLHYHFWWKSNQPLTLLRLIEHVYFNAGLFSLFPWPPLKIYNIFTCVLASGVFIGALVELTVGPIIICLACVAVTIYCCWRIRKHCIARRGYLQSNREGLCNFCLIIISKHCCTTPFVLSWSVDTTVQYITGFSPMWHSTMLLSLASI